MDKEDQWSSCLHSRNMHSGPIMSVTFSPDGRLIASGGHDQVIRVWDAETGTPFPKPLNGHSDSISALAFASNNRNVVSGSHDMTTRVWDVEQGVLVWTLREHTDWISCVAYHWSDENTWSIASGSRDGKICVWYPETIKEKPAILHGHKNGACCLSFSSNGLLLASGSDDKTIRIWDLDGGSVKELIGHTGSVLSVIFPPHTMQVISCAQDQNICVWNHDDGSMTRWSVGSSELASENKQQGMVDYSGPKILFDITIIFR